ncbi:C2 domain-containing protein [Rhizoctonia solani]|uniref:C2 domain-containing protein n=1 Tax=Rhizoctonia solani TaxID=456999 RepID=A0A8H8T0M8_9AGAM|nr:C2 domain-containing protein [Rhizoctonia solani]QRW25571.1 C2 domain-containing protein [Rhizoctonia solani]
MAYQVGQGYSEHNPIPTIQRYEADVRAREDSMSPEPMSPSRFSYDSNKDLPRTPPDEEPASAPNEAGVGHMDGAHSGEGVPVGEEDHVKKSEKQAVMDRMQGPKEKPTDKVAKKRGTRTVKDPTTGQMVTIKDADFKDYPNQSELDPMGEEGGPATQPVGGRDFKSHIPKQLRTNKTAPNPARPGNISLQPYPPSTPPHMANVLAKFDHLQIAIVVSGIILWFFNAFGRGFFGFMFARRLSALLRLVSQLLHRFPSALSRRKLNAVEWLNAFIKTIWGLINPEMFVSVADMIEDIMQQSLPGFVDAVRISDIGQGTNPFRIVSMRALPDQPGDKEYPREEWIDQGTNELMDRAEAERKAGRDADQAGDYVNFEVAFAYAALPGQGGDLRSKNIHLLIEFFLGLYDWLHIPIPIWIQVENIVGTVRLRIQFIPEPPFVRNLTFTLMGVPGVEVSAIPMSKVLPNVLDLPLVARFVKMAIAAGTAEFVAPKSMTLNIQEMLSGAAIGDTLAAGVFLITIHHAENLSAQDRNGRSDPYIVLAYAKFGKPLYSTRIVLGDLNPVYEETAALLLSQDEIKAEEDLSVMLWDSDKRSADDLIGRVQIPVKQLMSKPNEVIRRTDKLVGFEDATDMQGTLHWSIGYFPKVPLNKELERAEENPPPPSKTAPEMEMLPNDKAPNPARRDLPPPPPDVSRTPPDPAYPSGILKVVIHQINNLERQNLFGTTGKEREGQAGQDTDEPSEQGSNLPSGYCELIVNDDMIYKTRVKQYTTQPFFEAGTETFIRDWQNTVVRVVVRDARLRERDPILGIVNLNLKDLLKDASEVTRMFSLQEGIGFGRMNMSILFKGVDAKLPRNMLGWDTGTVELLSDITITPEPNANGRIPSKPTRLRVSTTDSTEVIAPKSATLSDGVVSYNIEKLRLPVYSRYASSCVFEFGGGGIMGGAPDALAVLWLKDLVDEEETDVRIPVVIGKDLRQLRQNVLNEQTKKTHEYEIVGWLTVRMRLDEGLDEDHEKHAASQARRHAFEAYDHVEGEALIAERNAHFADDGVIDKREKKELDAAHKRQLHNRQRGIAGYRPYRTAQWMKQGIKRRLMPKKSSSKREPTVNSEA